MTHLDSAEFYTIDSSDEYAQSLMWNTDYPRVRYIHDSDYSARKNTCISCGHYDNGLNCYEDSTGSYSGSVVESMFLPTELHNPHFYCPLNKFSSITLIGENDLDSA